MLGDLPAWFLRPLAVVLGLLWGSFLNVVIYRVPREMSVAHPPSTCGSCGTRIKPYDNIPVLSWLLLRGRARCCGAPISPRYPLVELIGGAIGLATLEVVVRALPPETSLARAGAVFVADFGLALALVAAAFIDLEHMFIPDTISIGGTVIGIATATLRGESFGASVVGAVAGYLMVWLPLIVVYSRIRGVQGMGHGDAKLTMLAGAWFGWGGALFVLCAAALQGTIAVVVVYLVKGKIEEPEAVRKDREELQAAAAAGDAEAAQILAEDPLGTEAPGGSVGMARFPFGPFLALACLETLLARDVLFALYERYFFVF